MNSDAAANARPTGTQEVTVMSGCGTRGHVAADIAPVQLMTSCRAAKMCTSNTAMRRRWVLNMQCSRYRRVTSDTPVSCLKTEGADRNRPSDSSSCYPRRVPGSRGWRLFKALSRQSFDSQTKITCSVRLRHIVKTRCVLQIKMQLVMLICFPHMHIRRALCFNSVLNTKQISML
jgi:hypothetical protein